jgi:PKD repeat protein
MIEYVIKNGGGIMGIYGKSIVFCTVLVLILSAFSAFSIQNAEADARALPVLSSPGVSPSTGNTSTEFTFSVFYNDSDGDMPKQSYVVINNGFYTMTTVYPPDAVRGMLYTYTTKLFAGNHTYYFSFMNVKNESINSPLLGGGVYYLQVKDDPSVKQQLYNPSHTPQWPAGNQTINFTVQYKDPQNENLKYVLLNIHPGALTVIYQYNMSIIGTDYSKGVTCYYELALQEGNYSYGFYALAKNNTVRDVQIGTFPLNVGPREPNYPYLAKGFVDPTSGTANKTQFTYYVLYDDGYNSIASVSKVVIDGVSYNMTRSNIGTGTTASLYSYSTTLSEGNHTFYFMFSDGRTNLTEPASGVYNGPVVTGQGNPTNNRPTVTLTASPMKGSVNTTFYFNATASDPDRDVLTFSWSFSDGYRVTGKSNVVRTFNSSGNYTATITVTDPGGLSASASVMVNVKPATTTPGRNNPPVIRTNLKTYQTVKQGTTMYISAKGTYDPDGDTLTYKWNILSPQSNLPAQYTTIDFNYTFKMPVNYTITLEVSDSKDKTSAKYFVYVTNNTQRQQPTAKITVTVKGMTAYLSGAGSSDPDGRIVSYTWTVESKTYTGMYHNHTYTTIGYKTAKLTVKDNDGLTGSSIVGYYIYNRSGGGTNDREYYSSNIISHVMVEDVGLGVPAFTMINAYDDFSMFVVESRKNYIKFELESSSDTGRLIIIDLLDIFEDDVMDRLEVRMDGERVGYTNLNSILNTAGDEPYFHLLDGGDHNQLLVYIDHFSKHILEVSAEAADDSGGTPVTGAVAVSSLLIIGICAVIVIVIIAAMMIQVKKKKKVEYYTDFRVAEETAMNGVHSKNGENDVDWDDYI